MDGLTEEQRRAIRSVVHGDPDKPVVFTSSGSKPVEQAQQQGDVRAQDVIDRLGAVIAKQAVQIAVLEAQLTGHRGGHG